MPDTFAIPYQNLSYKIPSAGELYKSTTEGVNDRLLRYRKEGKVYTIDPSKFATIPWQQNGQWQTQEAMMQSGLAALKSQYGIDYASLPAINPSDFGNLENVGGAGNLNWNEIFAGYKAPVGGQTVTRTIDPNNLNRAIDVVGGSPVAPPANYLQNLLGGQYINTPAQAQALYPKLTMEMPSAIPSKALISGATLPEPTTGQTISETQQKAGSIAASLTGGPKVGDPIPGTNLKYEAADIANLGAGGQIPYSNFVNVNGTIYNQQGKGYATPAELAQDLGIRPDQIDWSQIPAGNIPSVPSAPPPPTTNYSAQIAQADSYQQFLSDYFKRQESLWEKIKGVFGAGAPQETPEQIVDRLMPEVPAKVKELDLGLAQLETTYQQTILNADKRMAPMSFIRGEQALAERQYLINKNSLLMQRDALMGDYDRMVERGKMIYEIQKDQKAEQRENQQMAINFMLQTAQGQEAIALQAFQYQLTRQEKQDDRLYQEKQDELNSIKSIAAADPIAYAKFVAANGIPTSSSQLLAGIGKYKVSEKPNIFGSAEGGYYEQYYDMPTNTWKTRKVIGGTGNGNEPGIVNLFDSVIQAALDGGANASQAALAAVTYAETNGISLTVAERNTITKRASELKPTPKAETPKAAEAEKKPYVPSSPVSYGAGKEYGKIAGGVTETLLEKKAEESQFVYKNILQPIGSFFSGLFGK